MCDTNEKKKDDMLQGKEPVHAHSCLYHQEQHALLKRKNEKKKGNTRVMKRTSSSCTLSAHMCVCVCSDAITQRAELTSTIAC